jgi:uncharacterized protein with gpF-like domain
MEEKNIQKQSATTVDEPTPTDVVSNQQPVAQDTTKDKTTTPEVKDGSKKEAEFKLPTTKKELDIMLKSAINKANTSILKTLGVKSVKEFKKVQAKANEALTQFETLSKQNQELSQKNEAISKEFESLKQTSILDRLNIREEYRDDLIKLAQDKVTEENSFEAVIKELVETKYQYTVNGKAVKFGSEKTKTEDTTTLSPELQKKYRWLK